MIKIFKQLGWFIKEMKWRYLLVLLMLLTGDVFSLIVPWLTGYTIDQMTMKTLTGLKLTQITTVLVSIIVTGYITTGIWNYIFIQNANILSFKVLKKFFRHIIRMDGKFFKKYQTGDLMSRATEDVNAVSEAVDFGFLMLAEASLYLTLLISSMFVINPKISIIVLIPILIIPFGVDKLEKTIERLYEERQQSTSVLSNSVLESIAGVRVIRAYAKEREDIEKLLSKSQVTYDKSIAFSKVISLYEPLFIGVFTIAATLAIYFGIMDVFKSNMTTGKLVTYFVYVIMLEWPVFALGAFINTLQRGSGSYERIDAVYNEESDIIIPENPLNLEKIESIEFDNYSFSYPGSQVKSLDSFSISVKTGEILGIVGTTGSGKTTVIRQLLRQYKSGEGKILINNRGISEYDAENIRRHIAYVPQEHIVFSKTVYENIRLGNMNASRENIMTAIEHADFTKDIGTLTNGLETITGESGVMLSGGQKQRLSLARAFVRAGNVLILDDSLSAVDGKTEENIIGNIAEYYPEMIKIIVAHRLSAVRDANCIIVLQEGTIVEKGTHEELMELRGWYYDQFMEQNTMTTQESEEAE
ncbi:MAG: ABC transporter ATP-binding protein/permease [Fusobacteriales bacterium]|jgi:ATP-binding cassette subfamily B protein|nr:ABC transporter ATP-binding protein/permease [Fusobacteriales bacterium]